MHHRSLALHDQNSSHPCLLPDSPLQVFSEVLRRSHTLPWNSLYTRSAMGMPESETALEEMMCRVLGDFIEEGFVAKLADDLYCGGDSPEALLNNWRRVL